MTAKFLTLAHLGRIVPTEHVRGVVAKPRMDVTYEALPKSEVGAASQLIKHRVITLDFVAQISAGGGKKDTEELTVSSTRIPLDPVQEALLDSKFLKRFKKEQRNIMVSREKRFETYLQKVLMASHAAATSATGTEDATPKVTAIPISEEDTAKFNAGVTRMIEEVAAKSDCYPPIVYLRDKDEKFVIEDGKRVINEEETFQLYDSVDEFLEDVGDKELADPKLREAVVATIAEATEAFHSQYLK